MTATPDPLALLASLARPDGGWGYRAGQPAHLEPTCLALLALADRGGDVQVLGKGLEFLHRHRQPDASYRLDRGRPEAAWPTALALFTLLRLGESPDRWRPVADRLLTLRGRVLKADPEVSDMTDIDTGLLGWPWAEGTFSWVEPTSWAVLALRATGHGRHPRVREGLRLLLDRAFETGGANYGNRTILGTPTEPMPGPTALLLLALQGVDDPRADAAAGYLRTHARTSTDLEHLGWIRLALTTRPGAASRDMLPEIDARIRAALEREGDPASGFAAGPGRLAVAVLALDADRRNPFRLTDPPDVMAGTEPTAAEVVEPDPPAKPPEGLADRVRAKLRGLLTTGLGSLRPLPPVAGVHIARVPDYDEDAILAALTVQYAHFRAVAPAAGNRVVLKPNLVEYHRDKVINTDPRFVAAVIRLFQAEGAGEVIVAEGPGHFRNVQYLVNESGLGDVLRRLGVRFVDLNHDEPVRLPNLGRTTGLDVLYLARTVADAELFVSLPRLKTHHWAGATLSLKNLFGTVPGICYGWPKNELHWRGIPNSIVDIALTRTPHLAVIDGIVGMEGDGPINGTPRPVGAVVMGADLVAVDATGCRLMGLPPERIPTLVLAAEKRLGRLSDVPMLGEPVEALAQRFAWPPGVEKLLLPQK
jgi:uncharacterized protein (DUF362 family)